mmetsp:Transcript_6646/g.20120  ORF Transcript_6646/g.20120 Transcript_6646/m.20120 type:complete len:109 (-) Transcript_6646:1641-1967(-)
MPGDSHTAYTMGAITIAGGLAGYIRARSLPSIMSSVPIGLGFLASGYAIDNGKEYEGHLGAFICSGIMVAALAPRAVRTRKLFPGGVLSLLALASAVYEGEKTSQWAS